MPKHPLAEVFGFPPNNLSPEAERYRRNRLCPYNNKVPSCTKDKANDPLGVCSVFEGNEVAITCPIRLREDWLIAEDAGAFFFPENTTWTSLTEIRLNDKNGMSAGNIDVVLVAYDERGRVIDFGALEIQAVYISGNVRQPFEYYMEDPTNRSNMDWGVQRNYPRPDYLSSSRKRLAPQLIYKGGILKTWAKKQAVALHKSFFNRLPTLPEVDIAKADIAWLIYDLKHNPETNRYQLYRSRTVYTLFQAALERITIAEAGPIENFIGHLQSKLDERLDNPPDAPTLLDIM
ncbi:NotI family restriction endonuclease [Argonema galeatum]|uniref:NotI family restriction endonuclease n=1 Tax=Argonema galeatum TaxID=2942762 RepID=UPI0020113AC9|nr:NotI family restriction endonuclease [Argonema galeatum]MCL1468661.1 hypothetical protein [Argonema galeatum A003/A1]